MLYFPVLILLLSFFLVQVSNPGNVEVDGKSSEGKEKLPIKRSRGSLGSLNMITGKNNGPGKTSGASANGVHSKRYATISTEFFIKKGVGVTLAL